MAKSPIYPRTLAIGLSLTPPGPTDPGMEVAARGYVRQVQSFDLSGTAAGTLTNLGAVVWPRATSLWGNIGWLTAWDLDGLYAGFGSVISITDGVTTATTVRIDIGDVARFAVGALTLTDRNGPSLYGVGPYGVGPYSAGIPTPPRPYGRGSYGAGPYSRNPHALAILGVMSAAFESESLCCPDAATWTLESCGTSSWTAAGPCGASAWSVDALP
jgi:hypothetical protein